MGVEMIGAELDKTAFDVIEYILSLVDEAAGVVGGDGAHSQRTSDEIDTTLEGTILAFDIETRRSRQVMLDKSSFSVGMKTHNLGPSTDTCPSDGSGGNKALSI